MKRTLFHGVVIVTTAALCLADAWLWPQIGLAHRIEQVRDWARRKLDNDKPEDDDDGA